MRYILTTCGLSILTNGLKGSDITEKIKQYSNKKEEEIDKDFLEPFNKEYEKLSEKIKNYSDEELKSLSAEINALSTFYNGKFSNQDYHEILYTDTFLGKKASELLQDILTNKNCRASIFNIKDLKVSSVEEFHISLADAVKEISENLERYKRHNYEIIFNLTGGFKGIISFLQTMGALYADNIIYIFEDSKELMSIPKLPIKIDEDVIGRYFDTFRKLELGIPVISKEVEKIHRTLVLKIDTEYTLSPWGEIIWQKAKNDRYSEKLYPPFMDKIRYSKSFEDTVNKLQPDRMLALNKKIDYLTKYLLEKTNPKSLSFKELSGKPKHISTHEFYINSDEAKRCYCHFEDGILVLDEYGEHL